jgi:hypothetical protein
MLPLDVGFVQTDLWTVIDLLLSRATLEAEIVVLRQQGNLLRRANPNRLPFGSIDKQRTERRPRLLPGILRGIEQLTRYTDKRLATGPADRGLSRRLSQTGVE